MIENLDYSKIQDILDNINAAVILTDIKGRIVYVNKRCLEMTGYEKHEMIGRLHLEFSMPEDLPDSLNRLEQIIKGELKKYRVERQWKLKNGNIIWTGVSVAPLYDKNGNIEYLSANIVDISEKKKKEKLLKEQSIDIELSKKILAMVNSKTPRYVDISKDLALFADVVSLSCQQEGGDHFFIRELVHDNFHKKGRTLISIKDQSGHQVGCILKSIITDLIHQSSIHSSKNISLEQTVSDLNNSLISLNLLNNDDFITAVNCELDHENLMLTYVSCGHPAFLLIREEAILSMPEKKSGKGANPPLAVLENYKFSANRFQLKTGDKIILFTDGLIEASIPGQELQTGNDSVSLDKIKKVISAKISGNKKMPVQFLIDELLDYISFAGNKKINRSGKNDSNDDITLIGLEIEDKTDVIEEKWAPENIEALQEYIDKFIQNRMIEWKDRGFSKPFRLKTCFEEAAVNAWVHGNGADPAKPVFIKYRYQNDFHIEIIDKGRGFDMSKIPDPREPANRFRESGRGIFMIHNYSSRARWNKKGNRLTMAFKKEPNIHEKESIQMAQQCLNLWKR